MIFEGLTIPLSMQSYSIYKGTCKSLQALQTSQALQGYCFMIENECVS